MTKGSEKLPKTKVNPKDPASIPKFVTPLQKPPVVKPKTQP